MWQTPLFSSCVLHAVEPREHVGEKGGFDGGISIWSSVGELVGVVWGSGEG